MMMNKAWKPSNPDRNIQCLA